MKPRRGNCYVAAEALYHILGGQQSCWMPFVMRLPSGETHWFLRSAKGIVLDPSRMQFPMSHGQRKTPDYNQARGCGFLTKKPSKRARKLMKEMTWQTLG